MKILFNNFGSFTTIFSIQNLKMSVWFRKKILQIALSSRKNLRVKVGENEYQSYLVEYMQGYLKRKLGRDIEINVKPDID